MHLRVPWHRKGQESAEKSGSFYTLLRSEIIEIRKQGEDPEKDGESFSRYICDLCHARAAVSALRQCVICGRWACPDCWKDEYYVCNSCNGIIKLYMMPVPAEIQVQKPADTLRKSQEFQESLGD